MPLKSPYAESGSGYPVNVYLLIIIPALLLGIGLFNQSDLVIVMTNLPIGMLIFYILFSRFSSKVAIKDATEINITYFFPWDEDVHINPEGFDCLYYEKGLRRCYDVLRFTDHAGEIETIEVKINVRISGTERILTYIEQQTKLRVIRL